MQHTKKRNRDCINNVVKKKEVKKCAICGYDKYLGSFIYFNKDFEAIESAHCSKCNTLLKTVEKYCERVLEGVKIPYYETPVTKYKITDQNV